MGTLGLKLTREKYRDVTCGQCSRVFVTKEPRKLFCDPCGIQRRTKTVQREVRLAAPARWQSLKKIAEKKAAHGPGLSEVFVERPKYRWIVITSVPFSPNMSKNRRWSNNGRGAVFLSREIRDYQNALIADLRDALKDRTIYQAKLWISLHVQKPNHRWDAVNAVDTMCDAIKEAADLDDRWFCIDRVDWSIQKHEPRIFIRIGQEATCDMIACSHCGDVAPADTYGKRKHGKFGRTRVCNTCTNAINREKTQLRRESA